jgi:hypothetical protein
MTSTTKSWYRYSPVKINGPGRDTLRGSLGNVGVIQEETKTPMAILLTMPKL